MMGRAENKDLKKQVEKLFVEGKMEEAWALMVAQARKVIEPEVAEAAYFQWIASLATAKAASRRTGRDGAHRRPLVRNAPKVEETG